ncbi:MAG: RNA polymerase sigma factor RpoD/SigA [Thermodesulfobacteriota bacterium]
MGKKHIDFKKEISGINEHGEFVKKEETFASIANEDDTMFDLEPDFKSHELNSTEDHDEQQWTPDEQFRLFYAYFKDMSSEPLFTQREEIEVSAKIKKCEASAKKIKVMIDKLLNERDANCKKNDYRNGIAKELPKQINVLNALMKVYPEAAQRYKDRFVKANLRLVVSLAKRYTGMGLPLSDLIQEGNLGLMRAVERFDHTKGYKFSVYASWWINQGMLRALYDQTKTIRMPLYLQERAGRVYRVSSILHGEMGRKPTPEEISRRSGASVKIVKKIIKATNDAISLDSPIPDGEKTPLLDFLADKESPAQDSVVARTALIEFIKDALTLLNPREEKIIRLRFGIDQETSYTLDEVGRMFDLTRERIRQIEKAALEKIADSQMGEVLESFLKKE